MSPQGKSWLSSLLSSSNSNTTMANMQVQEPFHGSRDSEDWLFGQRTTLLDPNLEAKVLSRMPSLFSKTLPPCGLEIQIAYGNVVHRLRRKWLSWAASTGSTDNVPLYSVCTNIMYYLEQEQSKHAIESLHKTGTRTPWRRENVFRFEMRWSNYFVREAEVMQRWPSMNESEKEKQVYMHQLYPIPKELKISIKNKENKKGVMELWKKWNEGKRKDMLTEEWQEIDGETREGQTEDMADVDGTTVDSMSSLDLREVQRDAAGGDMDEERVRQDESRSDATITE